MRARGAVAFAVALVAALLVGLWLGGHPSGLPGFLRDRFVAEPAGLTTEAAEVIKDNYFRPVGNTELANSSLQGMVRELRKRHNDRFSDYFSPEAWKASTRRSKATSPGSGSASPKSNGAAGAQGLRRLAGRRGRDRSRRHDRLGRRRIDRRRQQHRSDREDQRPGRDQGDGRRARRQDRQGRRDDPDPGRGRAAERQQPDEGRRRPQARLRPHALLQRRRPRRARRRRWKRSRGKGRKGSSSTCAATPAACSTRRCSAPASSCPKGEVVVSTKSRTQGDSVHKTVGGNLPKLPLVVLIDRDTASAAEILTAALADDGGATVVGTRSYGKGVFQEEQASPTAAR